MIGVHVCHHDGQTRTGLKHRSFVHDKKKIGLRANKYLQATLVLTTLCTLSHGASEFPPCRT